MNSKILYRTIVQQSLIEACGIKKLLIGETCRRMCVTWQVSFKAFQCDTHHRCLVFDLDYCLPDYSTADKDDSVVVVNRSRSTK